MLLGYQYGFPKLLWSLYQYRENSGFSFEYSRSLTFEYNKRAIAQGKLAFDLKIAASNLLCSIAREQSHVKY
jgi:hypothetical protein